MTQPVPSIPRDPNSVDARAQVWSGPFRLIRSETILVATKYGMTYQIPEEIVIKIGFIESTESGLNYRMDSATKTLEFAIPYNPSNVPFGWLSMPQYFPFYTDPDLFLSFSFSFSGPKTCLISFSIFNGMPGAHHLVDLTVV